MRSVLIALKSLQNEIDSLIQDNESLQKSLLEFEEIGTLLSECDAGKKRCDLEVIPSLRNGRYMLNLCLNHDLNVPLTLTLSAVNGLSSLIYSCDWTDEWELPNDTQWYHFPMSIHVSICLADAPVIVKVDEFILDLLDFIDVSPLPLMNDRVSVAHSSIAFILSQSQLDLSSILPHCILHANPKIHTALFTSRFEASFQILNGSTVKVTLIPLEKLNSGYFYVEAASEPIALMIESALLTRLVSLGSLSLYPLASSPCNPNWFDEFSQASQFKSRSQMNGFVNQLLTHRHLLNK